MSKKLQKILIVEDEIFLLKVLKAKLEKLSYKVSSDSLGGETLNIARNEEPDLIILDIALPVKNGFQILADLKADKKTSTIPVLILTKLGGDEDIAQGKHLKCSEYLIKTSVNFSKIIKTIQLLIEPGFK